MNSESIAVPMNKTAQQTPDLVVASQDVLLQGLGLLFNIWDKTFSRVAEAPYNASIGGHYRQILERFQCLVRGIRSGEINYDARERDPRLETEVTYATIATCDVLRAIKNYTEAVLARPCKVINSVSYGSAQPSVSDVRRELAYCASQAIHHYAIIRLICSHLGVEVPNGFGIAPSTLKFRSSRIKAPACVRLPPPKPRRRLAEYLFRRLALTEFLHPEAAACI